MRRLLLLSVLLLFGSVASAAPAATGRLQGAGWSAGFRDGMLVELRNRLTGEVLVTPGPAFGQATGVRRSRDQVLATAGAEPAARLSGTGGRLQATWPGGVRLTQTAAAEGDSLVIRQDASAGAPPVAGVQWALASAPPEVEVLVPGNSGMRFGPGAPDGDWGFDYPINWEAQFVLLQGKGGGFLVWTDDDATQFKALAVTRRAGRTRLAFESRATAPFAAVKSVRSVAWRVRPYKGSWLEGARLYRQWAEKAFGLAAIRAKRPRWMARIRCVVIVPMEMALLDELAKRLKPEETLLYVPNWRRDGYDRNYPDYTALPEFGPWNEKAHALGFRVMPHVNYFGCDPLNPLYEQFRAHQMRDPFTNEPQWWLWDRADPIIKFAYINPASRAWRQLFVSRMKELCTKYQVDALHLDQTLCIFNDNNGIIDGMNCMQGNIALHRDLHEALPDVALSGEGLDEITYRYEEFCQRHLYGLNHVDGTWSDRCLAMAHPVSSSLLTPHTTIYGYLGMSNPSTGGLYQAWRKGYDHFGVIPTLAFPDARQVRDDRDLLDPFFREAAFFQRTQALPDFAGPWPQGVLLRYRLAGGGRAALVRDRGVVLVADGGPWTGDGGKPPASAPVSRPPSPVRARGAQQIYRRVEGVSSVALPGSIPGWRAYDGKRLIGLDPAQRYSYRPERPDLQGFHVAALPEAAVVRRAGLRGDLATIGLEDRGSEVARLWEFAGRAQGGVLLFDKTERRYPGAFFADASGGGASPESGGVFLHPPWRLTRRDQQTGINLARGIGVSFVEYHLKLPNRPRIRFETGVCLRDGAAGKSDGVIFTASAWVADDAATRRGGDTAGGRHGDAVTRRRGDAARGGHGDAARGRGGDAATRRGGDTARGRGGEGARGRRGDTARGRRARANHSPLTTRPLTKGVHNDGADPKPLALDLSSLRGKEVVIRLQTHPGPQGQATFDWALFREPRVVAESPAPQEVVVHCPRAVVAALGPAGELPLSPAGANGYAVRTPLPGTFQLLFAQPQAADLPLDLIAAPRSVALVSADGIEQPPSGFAQAQPAEGVVGGVSKRALSTHPPSNGRIVVDYILRLPATPARLNALVGIRDGSVSKGVGFSVQANGGELWSARMMPKEPWKPVEVDLSRYAGQALVLSLVTDSLGSYEFDWAVWAEPRVTAR